MILSDTPLSGNTKLPKPIQPNPYSEPSSSQINIVRAIRAYLSRSRVTNLRSINTKNDENKQKNENQIPIHGIPNQKSWEKMHIHKLQQKMK